MSKEGCRSPSCSTVEECASFLSAGSDAIYDCSCSPWQCAVFHSTLRMWRQILLASMHRSREACQRRVFLLVSLIETVFSLGAYGHYLLHDCHSIYITMYYPNWITAHSKRFQCGNVSYTVLASNKTYNSVGRKDDELSLRVKHLQPSWLRKNPSKGLQLWQISALRFLAVCFNAVHLYE